MGSMEELEGRVSALEGQMRSVRQDAAAARVLAGGADRDVATLTTRMDAQTRLMQALRETQVEDHGAILELKGDVGELKGDVGELKGDVAGLKGDVAVVKGDVAGLKGDVAVVKGDVAGLKGDMAAVKGAVAGLRGDVGDLTGSVRGLEIGQANLARGQEIIIDLLRRRDGESGPGSAG